MPLPNSLPWMESVDAKMIRAHENIEALNREINDWFATIKIKMYLKSAPDQLWPWLVIHATDYIPPIRLSILVGECVHNMRSALDNLVCGLARTVNTRCECKKTAFPFRENQADWNAHVQFDLEGVPKPAKKIIKHLQRWLDTTSPNPLVILNKLSNSDKHRVCNFTLPHNRKAIFLIHCTNGMILNVPADKPLYLGDVQTFTLQLDKALIEPSARVQASGTLVLTFQEESEWDDSPVIQVLQNCFDHIEKKVIAPLKPFFEPKVS
jgi:hypothetical protein